MSGLQTQIAVKDGVMSVLHTQDCNAIADHCKARHNEGHHGSSDMRFAGTIPEVFVLKYMNDNALTYAEVMQGTEHIKRMMNDPALAHFRVWKGRL